MPTARHVSLVQKLRWHVSGNISPTAFAIGDIDGQGDNAFVIGNLAGTLFIFKGNQPEGQPWLTCKELGTITAVAIGDIRNWGKNSIVVLSAEGLCHIFDIAGLDDENGHILSADNSIPLAGPNRSGNPSSIYSSTPGQGSYHQLPLQNGSYQGQSVSPQHSNIPATPSIRPVPDHSCSHHSASSHPYHGTPSLPPSAPLGSSSSTVSGCQQQQQQYTSNSTPSNSHPSSIHGGSGGTRRGSEAISSSGASIRTATALANLIGTPTPSSSAGSIHGASSSSHHTRSFGGNSTANSPTGTPVLRPQQLPSNNASAQSSKDHSGKKTPSSVRYDTPGKPHVRHVGGRRVLERPNLTLPVPVNINRAHIADIDGDGLNEIVLARTDRILHSYALQTDKAASPTASSQPNNQTLNLVKLLSRTSSVSTLDSSGLLSPSDDRRETVIHYPPLSSKGRPYYGGSNAAMLSAGLSQGNPEVQEANSNNDSSCLVLVEKKRWALDGQIHCLSVTKDIHTGMPILLVAQPGLKFVMVDHTGNISEPITQVQRNSNSTCNLGPDTPTCGAGTGDVATDILCGTHYVNGEKKDIIGLMSMDGAFALHDLESNTVKVHDLDSTHKIFGFSKLNFGKDYMETRVQESRRTRESYRRSSSCNADEINHDVLDDGGLDENGDERGDMDSGDDDGCEHRSSHARWTRRSGSPSLLISEPYGSRFQKDDIFVGCSWSGITFFIDQEFNTTLYDFDARVCAFGAGQYAVTPGRNEPCLFYVDFEDNIFVYYNLYIQTKPVIQFQDIVKSDLSLIQKGERIHAKGIRSETGQQGKNQNDCENGAISGSVDANNRTVSSWTDHDIKSFIHDSLYNVNRYDDEYQRLRRLADIERAKRARFFEEKSMKERRRQDAERVASADTGTSSVPANTLGPSIFMDPRKRRPPHVLTLDTAGAEDGAMRTQLKRGRHPTSSQYTRSRQDAAYADNEHHHSPVSPRSPVSPTSTCTNTGYLERRRSSLLIKDVLSHYEGKVTPPLKSPTSPSVPSNQSPKDHRAMTYASAVSASTLPGILKRFSIKDLGNGKRLSRSSSTGSGSGNGQNTITQGHVHLGGSVLNKGKALETRVGKALRANRPLGAPRNRHLGVMTRKLSTRSRLSLQQDREDETEEGEDDVEQEPSDDGIGENDDENMLEFDRSSHRSVGDDEDQQAPEEDEDTAGDGFFSRERGNEEQGEDDTPGVYTPSTISPIPSPGRFYGSQSGNAADPSPSLDGSAFILAKSLLSPSNRSILSGSSAATSNAGAVGKNSRHADNDHSHDAPSSSISRGHMRQRSGHGLLDVGLGLLPTREITATSGINSGPNSAGHCSNQDGRRSRAESVLSTGSDIGGVIVPDITLLASSFPNQPSIPLSTSEPLPQGTIMSDDDEMDITPSNDTDLDNVTIGIRRAPRRSATTGSQEEFHGAGPAFDVTPGKSSSQQSMRHSIDSKGADVKLMPAPLPRSSQHHQRQQQEQQGSSATGLGSKDGRLSSAGHIMYLSGTRSSNSGGVGGGGEMSDGHSLHNGIEGFGRGLAGKSSSTTSSATASDIGSGPSSPLAGNVTSVNAILSNPSTNGNKGFGVLSIPVASPSASIASVQNQYFAQSHYPLQSAHQYLASSLHSRAIHPQDPVGVLEDDRVSIRSRTSTYRGADENNDITALLAAGASTAAGGNGMDGGGAHDEHGIFGMSTTPSSTSHLTSNSLIRRLEELQMQDHNLGEKQRLKEDRAKSAVGTQSRPSALSRANSGASIQSAVSHRTPSQPLTSHSSMSGSSNHPSALGSGPASGSGKSPWDDDHESTKRLKNRLGMGEGL